MFFTPLTKSKLTFEGERPYENVRILLYRHWFVLFMRLVPFAILAVLPILIIIIFGSIIVQIGLTSIFNFAIVVYYLIWWSGLFYTLTMYLLDTWMVTDHRILDNEQHGFFSRTLTETSLSKVQDMSVNTKGLIATLFGYGYLDIQTAGAIPKIEMKQIPDPNGVKNHISQVLAEFNGQHKNGVEVHNEPGI
jgi:uncharacterized membrane protein YdbT with pleckstrin-like domain